jgi:hypothetical protein
MACLHASYLHRYHCAKVPVGGHASAIHFRYRLHLCHQIHEVLHRRVTGSLHRRFEYRIKPKGMRFPLEVILVCIRWYAAYPLSYRQLEELMQE